MPHIFELTNYMIRRKVFRIFGGAFHIYDPAGQVVGYSKQKAFKLREDIRLGQRLEGVAVDAFVDGAWKEIAKAEAIGNRRLLAFEPVTTDRVRLRITAAQACPAIQELSLYQGKP